MNYEASGFTPYANYTSFKPLTITGDVLAITFTSLGIFCYILQCEMLVKSQVPQSSASLYEKIFSLAGFQFAIFH